MNKYRLYITNLTSIGQFGVGVLATTNRCVCQLGNHNKKYYHCFYDMRLSSWIYSLNVLDGRFCHGFLCIPIDAFFSRFLCNCFYSHLFLEVVKLGVTDVSHFHYRECIFMVCCSRLTMELRTMESH